MSTDMSTDEIYIRLFVYSFRNFNEILSNCIDPCQAGIFNDNVYAVIYRTSNSINISLFFRNSKFFKYFEE